MAVIPVDAYAISRAAKLTMVLLLAAGAVVTYLAYRETLPSGEHDGMVIPAGVVVTLMAVGLAWVIDVVARTVLYLVRR